MIMKMCLCFKVYNFQSFQLVYGFDIRLGSGV